MKEGMQRSQQKSQGWCLGPTVSEWMFWARLASMDRTPSCNCCHPFIWFSAFSVVYSPYSPSVVAMAN